MDVEPDTSNKEPVERAWNYARAIDMAMAGATNKQIALDLQVDVTTISRFFNSGNGQQLLRAAMLESMQRTEQFSLSAHNLALRTLVKAMSDADTKMSDKINAARAILASQTKRVEITGLGGGAIEVSDSTALDLLRDRLDTIRNRYTDAIDARTVDEPVALEAVETPEDAETAQPDTEAPETADTATEEPMTAPRQRRTRVRSAV